MRRNPPWWQAMGKRAAPKPAPAPPPHPAPSSYAQSGQDLAVLAYYGHKRGGYFVDVGAFDGVDISNTLLLERAFGWRGLAIEPDPESFAALRRNRSCQCVQAAVAGDASDAAEFAAGGGHSSALTAHINTDVVRTVAARGRKLTLRVRTLTELLDEAGAPSFIEYLSVDTEGADFEVLRGTDFSRYRFGYITVEHNFVSTHRDAIRSLLESRGYVRVRENGQDDDYALPFHDWYHTSHRSGPGSTEEYTAGFRDVLDRFLRDHAIGSVLDYGCGDWQWARLVDWNGADYTGVDIVPEVIEGLTREHARPGRRFERIDPATWLPRAHFDLAICKDVLCHLPLAEAQSVADALRSCARHILWISDTHDADNAECARGAWRPLDLTRAPFFSRGRLVYEFPPGPWRKQVLYEERGAFTPTRLIV